MPKFTIKIESVLGGIAPNLYQGKVDQFAASIGIDPDQTLGASSDIKTSGVLVPYSPTDISGANLTDHVNWIVTNPKDENVYVYCDNGRFISYSSALGAETLVNSAGSTVGEGAAYYNNYIYLATGTDINEHGPLDGTPAVTTSVWTGAKLGTQTALGNATYPTQRGVRLPNHPMYVHMDNKLYVGDFETANNARKGRGKVHWIRTTISGANVEGNLNDGTTQNAFLLPFGYAPTAISSWGTDLVIAAIPMSSAGAGATIVQGKAKLFFWDAINAPTLPYREVTLIDPVVTALLNHNGQLYVWSGNMNNGVRVSLYEGGYRTKQIAFFEEGFSPPAGCVDGLGNRIAWGAFTTYPENSMSVYALGYKDANLPIALHNIANTTGVTTVSTNAMVTAVKYVQHASFISPRFLVGWKDGAATENFGIDRFGTSAGTSVWRTLTYAVGKPFRINKVTIPLGTAIAANMTLIPSIRVDDDSTATSLTTINNTNYAVSERRITQYPRVYGNNNFNFQLRWTGTTILPVTLPIVIEGETLHDATR